MYRVWMMSHAIQTPSQTRNLGLGQCKLMMCNVTLDSVLYTP